MIITKSQLKNFNIDELRTLRDLIHDEIASKAQEVKYELSVGTKVKINHKKTVGKIFTVVDVKRKKALLQDNSLGFYNVALSLIEVIK
jgi:hypothetical protein